MTKRFPSTECVLDFTLKMSIENLLKIVVLVKAQISQSLIKLDLEKLYTAYVVCVDKSLDIALGRAYFIGFSSPQGMQTQS